MAASYSHFVFIIISMMIGVAFSGNFYDDTWITWGESNVKILDNGNLCTLSLDASSGCGFRSNSKYAYGKFEMDIKLVPGDSAGTVTTFYVDSKGPTWDEIDFEFLGNVSGNPYTLLTNIFTQGQGNREQQFHLWFDPTADFHTYTILWNRHNIILFVDGVAIRVFKNMESSGVPYPTNQKMRMESTIWNADWATRGGEVKIDWSKAPFTASYRNFVVYGCAGAPCTTDEEWFNQKLNDNDIYNIGWVQKYHMIYNYCTDSNRFPSGLPIECR